MIAHNIFEHTTHTKHTKYTKYTSVQILVARWLDSPHQHVGAKFQHEEIRYLASHHIDRIYHSLDMYQLPISSYLYLFLLPPLLLHALL